MSPAQTTERGVFVVIEGTDGSGKGTQFKLICERLEQAGYPVATFDFPQYDRPSSYFVTEYLNGKYGSADDVGPYTASLFFALDRYEAAAQIREALAAGKVVLANRFVGSNMAHQGTKFAHAEERRGYFIWLDNLEFQMLRIPRPDLSIVLRVPAETAQQLVDRKEARDYTAKKRDIHEADLSHLQRSVEVYDDLCQLFPKDFTRIDCVRGDRLLSVEEISTLLWEKIAPRLPKKVTRPAPAAVAPLTHYSIDDIYTPSGLDSETRVSYTQTIQVLLEKRASLLERKDISPETKDALAQALLPVAAYVGEHLVAQKIVEQHQNASLANLAAEVLPPNHNQPDTTELQLVDYWPRNEMRIVPAALYPYADLPLRSLSETVDSWQYDLKASALEAYTAGSNNSRQGTIGYILDVFADTDTMLAFSQVPNINVYHQGLSPRYGYRSPDMPEDLSDAFDDCFDLSMRLYSQLQTAGNTSAAQYATLLGHKTRFLLVLTDGDLSRLRAVQFVPKVESLVSKITELIANAHPILTGNHLTSVKNPQA